MLRTVPAETRVLQRFRAQGFWGLGFRGLRLKQPYLRDKNPNYPEPQGLDVLVPESLASARPTPTDLKQPFPRGFVGSPLLNEPKAPCACTMYFILTF